MELGDLIPPRVMADVIAQRVRLHIGGEDYLLPALCIADSEEWQERLDAEVTDVLNKVEAQGDDIGKVLETLATNPDRFMDLLIWYDRTDVLPDKLILRQLMTQMDLLRCCLEVWRAANPLVDIGLGIVTTTARRVNALPRLMSSQQPNTTGQPGPSGAN